MRSQFSRCRAASSRLPVIVGTFDHFLLDSVQNRSGFHSSDDATIGSIRGKVKYGSSVSSISLNIRRRISLFVDSIHTPKKARLHKDKNTRFSRVSSETANSFQQS